MTWFKVDDGFWSHPKTAALTDSSIALWVRAGSYCCQHLTDGFVAAAILHMVRGSDESAAELVESGLWVNAPGGWRFHDWDEYQETSETVKSRREKSRERQRKRRALRDDSRGTAPEVTRGVTRDSERDSRRECATPDPTRPDPTREVLRTSLSAPAIDVDPSGLVIPAGAERDHPMILIPDDWEPDPLTLAKHPRPDITDQADAFRDHARAVGRRCHGMAGWNAAFSSWLRKNAPPGQGAATTKAQGWVDLAHQFTDQPEQKAIR